jgi:uncharacterized Zn finger protein
MDLREQRGLELAATRNIRHKGGIWFVPSQSSDGTLYQVNIAVASCTCPDHETRGVKCKHIYAASYVMQREQNADGSITVTEQLTVTEPENLESTLTSAQKPRQLHKNSLERGPFSAKPPLPLLFCKCSFQEALSPMIPVIS